MITKQSADHEQPETDFSSIGGQQQAKRVLRGRHNTLLIGPPGCGKSMRAGVFLSIMSD